MQYESTVETRSEKIPGVRFTVERMSFGRRLELIRQLKGWLGRLEFVKAGDPSGPEQQAEAALVAGEIDRIYLRWGLRGIEGFAIDGEAVTPENLMEKGPEELVREILDAIRREAGLSETERKNFKSPSISCEETRPDGSATPAAV
ncbi:MAG TPA: hypothetical protein VEU62_04150 [Bryobacterales bacterium]|nr:hypothetical protein [Bryobacterales bacterium]